MNEEIQKSQRALLEEEVLKFWQEQKVFEKSLEKDSTKGEYVFYEGPPTANGKPGIHHLEARAFKDAILRYKTMQGYHVERKGGWDTHGLPVEIQVEKKLNLESKKAIEEYGIAKFNKECKESVWEYTDIWEKFTDRIGFWVDQENPYVTYYNDYMESVWNVIKEANKQDLLYKDYKIVPWCPRCGTGLSSHELAQGYQDVKDLTVYVKLRLLSSDNTFVLVWTTTPWTLPANVALAVGEDIDYVKIEQNGEFLILAKSRLAVIEGEPSSEVTAGKYKIVEEMKGKDLVGLEYEPLYPYLNNIINEEEKIKLEKAYKVYPANFVTTEDGTGVVHIAPMYGQDDFDLGNKVGLPKCHLVGLDGKFFSGTDFLEERFVRSEDVAVDIIKELAGRGLLLKKEKYEHTYPHCWRCKTALIYYARDSWYIRMTQLRDKMIKENEGINWEPANIKEGRFGEWLRDIKDWAISRERYWGTPLPVWTCDKCKKIEVIGGLEDIKNRSKKINGEPSLPVNEKGEVDLHKPFIDEVELTCDCGGKLVRAKEVMDVWLDSGSMPFAQSHYPFENKELIYPADFISEGVDQTRGWFYTLHAVGTIMGKGKAFRNVICLGLILDANGKKMSKSVGNIVDPWEMMNKYGVDTLRLWMYSVNQPGEPKNFDEKTVAELNNKIFNLLYNVLAFYELYRDKNIEGGNSRQNLKEVNVLDKWIIARLEELTESATKQLDSYKLLEPVRSMRLFIDDLSTWYLRRSRDRIKSASTDGSGETKDGEHAKATLYYVLKNLAKLMAPFAPFAAEDIWQKLRNENDAESIHLEKWATPQSFDSKVIEEMEEVRDVVTLGLQERQKAGIPVRQPLQELVVTGYKLPASYVEIIKDELNVKEVRTEEGTEKKVTLDLVITDELKKEGLCRELVRAVQDIRKKNGLNPNDVVTLEVFTAGDGQELVDKFKELLMKSVSAKEIIFKENEGMPIKVDNIEFIINVVK